MIINGSKVIIKSTEESDLIDIEKLWNNGKVMKWVGFPQGLNTSVDKLKEWYEDIQKSEIMKHFVVKSIEYGFCGEVFYEMDLFHKRAGLDIKFMPNCQGKGLAREALTLLIDYIFNNEKDIDAVWTEPSDINKAARKLYTKCGLIQKERPKDLDPEESYWELSRADWNKKIENVFKKAQSFKYNSVTYVDLEDIGEIEKEYIINEEKSVFILKEEVDQVKLYWGAETKDKYFDGLNRAIKLIKDKNINKDKVYIEFVQPEFVDDMKNLSFSIVSEWIEFWVKNLKNVQIRSSQFNSIKLLDKSQCREASKVLCSCKGYSRGFNGESEEWIKEWINNENSCILAAEVNGKIVGVCCLNIYGFDNEKGPILWLREVAVSPDYQGKGIGHALIENAFKWGIRNGAQRSFLHSDAENYNATKLYEKFGYRKEDERGQINMLKILK